MLVKTKEPIETYRKETATGQVEGNSWSNVFSQTGLSGWCHIYFRIRGVSSASGSYQILINGTVVDSGTGGSSESLIVKYNSPTYLNSAQVQIQIKGGSSSSKINYLDMTVVCRSYELTINTNDFPPRALDIIGELGFLTMEGNHIQNEYVGMIYKGTTESVETGSITVGNAKGYLKLKINGEIVCIPYYGEFDLFAD